MCVCVQHLAGKLKLLAGYCFYWCLSKIHFLSRVFLINVITGQLEC